jgi:hypothetical protein
MLEEPAANLRVCPVWVPFLGGTSAAADVSRPYELDAVLLADLWEAAARVRPGAPYVAKRLVDGARHRGFAAIRREEDWTGRIAPLQGEIGESQTVSADDGDGRDVLTEAVAAGIISGVEAELFRTPRAAIPRLLSRLGISESAARSRRPSSIGSPIPPCPPGQHPGCLFRKMRDTAYREPM